MMIITAGLVLVCLHTVKIDYHFSFSWSVDLWRCSEKAKLSTQQLIRMLICLSSLTCLGWMKSDALT